MRTVALLVYAGDPKRVLRCSNKQWLQPKLGEWKDTQFWGSGNAVQALTDCAYWFVAKRLLHALYLRSSNDYGLHLLDSLRSGSSEMVPIIRDIFSVRGTAAIELLGIGSYDDMQWWSLAYGTQDML